MSEREPFRIFYSWQSDSPNSTNRGFVQRALEAAAETLTQETEIEAVVDRDTLGISGSPSITASIFEKIDGAGAFVADVTTIGKAGDRWTANPNVLFETGYATHALGNERVILVVNTAGGPVSTLPFDLQGRRVVTYECREADAEKALVRRELASKLRVALGELVKGGVPQRLPDIRVRCSAAMTGQTPKVVRESAPLSNVEDVIVITVENHSDRKLFRKSMGFGFARNDGNVLVMTHDIWGMTVSDRELEPGASETFAVRAKVLLNVDPDAIRCAYVQDQLGRMFEATGDETRAAIRAATAAHRSRDAH